jgi:hypothetical protein
MKGIQTLVFVRYGGLPVSSQVNSPSIWHPMGHVSNSPHTTKFKAGLEKITS